MSCFDITMRRGDSKEFTLEIFDRSVESLYILDESDRLTMAATRFGELIFHKELTREDQDEDGVIHISFAPEETEKLLAPDKYKYYIKLFFADGEVDTLIPPDKENAYFTLLDSAVDSEAGDKDE